MRSILAALSLCLMTVVPCHADVSDGKEYLRSGLVASGRIDMGRHGSISYKVTKRERVKKIGGPSARRGALTAAKRNAAVAGDREAPVQWGASSVVTEARSYLGLTAKQIGLKRWTLWCATFANHVLKRTGYRGTGSDLARSFARYGHRVGRPVVGAIAVMSRGRRGGHVGIVSGIDARGNPIIISGNHNRRVAEVAYPRGRVYAYVMPR